MHTLNSDLWPQTHSHLLNNDQSLQFSSLWPNGEPEARACHTGPAVAVKLKLKSFVMNTTNLSWIFGPSSAPFPSSGLPISSTIFYMIYDPADIPSYIFIEPFLFMYSLGNIMYQCILCCSIHLFPCIRFSFTWPAYI